MPPRIPIGVDDFRKLREAAVHKKIEVLFREHAYLVDSERLQAMDYAAELRAAGAAPVHAFAVAFDGKEVHVRAPGGE